MAIVRFNVRSSVVDHEKVAKIKAQVEKGEFKPDASNAVNNMLVQHKETMRSTTSESR